MDRVFWMTTFLAAGALAGCGAAGAEGAAYAYDDEGYDPGAGGQGGSGGSGGYAPPCGGGCQPGFICEFDTCVPDQPAPNPSGESRSPLASDRYVFSLETDSRRLVRIDSVTLEVEAFVAGLAPMDMAVVGSRELTVLLDAFHLIEILDHREEPPVSGVWETEWAMSHLAVSPTGNHVIAYYDWDDPRSPDRQPETGNINRVSVLYTGDDDQPFADEDPRVEDSTVGSLPRDVRFASDGSRAVIISRGELTPIDLGSPYIEGERIAEPQLGIEFDDNASEILIDAAAATALLRYQNSARLHLVDLDGGAVTCFEADGAIGDVAFASDGRLLVQYDLGLGDGTYGIDAVDLAEATPEPCAALVADLTVTDASRIAVDLSSDLAIAYEPDLDVEQVWRLDLATFAADLIRLEKGVQGIAFAGDGRFALASHLKKEGTPDWTGDPEEAVDRSYGVTWLDLETLAHRLLITDVPLSAFAFVPATDQRDGATYQAVSHLAEPQVLRVSHASGFDESWLDLAAFPRELGYLPETDRVYVTQDHPWGRVTFIDGEGGDLRHVTGFAIGVQ